MDFFLQENISRMIFKDGKEIQKILKREATKIGFDIYSRNNILDPHPVFYCSFGGRKNNRSSNKSNCPFYLRFTPRNPHNFEEGFVFSKGHLNHEGHILEPSLFVHHHLDENQKDTIRSLHISGCPNVAIQNYIISQGGPFLSSFNIDRILYKSKIDNFSDQTQSLMEYIESKNGQSYTYDIENNHEIQRIAVFTLSVDEIKNIEQYFDVVFIDPTFICLQNNWNLIPITHTHTHYPLIAALRAL